MPSPLQPELPPHLPPFLLSTNTQIISGQPPPDSVVPTERAAGTLLTIKDWKQLHLLLNNLKRSFVKYL